jgi:hypothetical protein
MIQQNCWIALLMVLLLSSIWMGCSSNVKERRGEAAEGSDMGVGKYYFFDDILIPNELSYDEDESFVYETPQFKTGSMVFTKWRLDPNSLVDFFTYYMEKDNWKLMNSFRGAESILNFSKADKACIIKIFEKWYGTTVVEIRVGPLGMKKM